MAGKQLTKSEIKKSLKLVEKEVASTNEKINDLEIEIETFEDNLDILENLKQYLIFQRDNYPK